MQLWALLHEAGCHVSAAAGEAGGNRKYFAARDTAWRASEAIRAACRVVDDLKAGLVAALTGGGDAGPAVAAALSELPALRLPPASSEQGQAQPAVAAAPVQPKGPVGVSPTAAADQLVAAAQEAAAASILSCVQADTLIEEESARMQRVSELLSRAKDCLRRAQDELK